MIRLEALTLSLGKRTVVDGVTLSIASRRVTAIIGPNGAGKTSLVRAIAGLIRPQSGDVAIDGEAVLSLSDRDRARRIGYMPQNGTPAWAITVRDMVALGRLPHRAAFAGEGAEDRDAIEAAMRDTDTLQLAARAVDTLSGGERARVKMARVLAGHPGWLIADEPLANLDPPHQMDMLHLFRTTADGGAGVITVLHQLDAAAQADDIIMLADGKLVAAGRVQTTLTAGNLEATFGIGFTLLESGALRIPIPSR